MRGRTNADRSGSLAINGDIKQFKVAEGVNIAAGDFVEYKEQINEYFVSNTEINMYKCKQISEGISLTISGNSLLLLKMIDNELKIVDSYNSKVVIDYSILTDGGIAVSVTTYPYIIKLRIENDLFSYVCGMEGDTSKYTYADVIEEVGGVLWALNVKALDDEYGKRKFYTVLRRFELLEYNKITFLDILENTYASTKLPPEGVSMVGNIANSGIKCDLEAAVVVNEEAYIIGTSQRYNSSSENWLKSYFTVKFVYKNNSSHIDTIDTENQRVRNNQSPISFFDKYVLDNINDACRLYNAESGVKTNINVEMDSSNTHWSKIGENRFALGDSGRMAVYEIDANTGEVSKVSEVISFSASMYRYIGVLYLKGIINQIFTSKEDKKTMSRPFVYESQTGQITEEMDTTSVKQYSGGSAIGVSNQSGTAGQKIDVYVPKV